jgi:TonB family protein
MNPTGIRVAIAALVLAPVLMLAPSRSLSQEPTENARKVLTRVEPQYPSLARPMNIRGSVRAVVSVAANGTVKSVEVKGGHPLLVDAAQNALRQWKFAVAPHETYETIEIRFSP